MKVIHAAISDVLVFQPSIHLDARGWFFESFSRRTFAELTGMDVEFVQDNHSCSVRGTLRGLHYQVTQPQGKLVRVIRGEVFDVAVDLRRSSPTFAKWVSRVLSAQNREMTWIPQGFAHGFLVLSDQAEVIYKTTDYYQPSAERSILWSDPALGVAWPLTDGLLLSDKDRFATRFADAELFE
ncbi:dTDP-4-dehydrorhamnose 3,5-epimerase [Cupriavidus metallidurans]|uniref:dTDP-4-dehydrorhamnose 3,5-epimerase n=1 Tax=Cupriavidus metallidurans TaxID=119219 RepID=UPI00164827B4|nr:dTDP-4-dehydrorhamnose 3,5-epimerase [Cupriavidus metallidurans]